MDTEIHIETAAFLYGTKYLYKALCYENEGPGFET
jgi:hypothetical protein